MGYKTTLLYPTTFIRHNRLLHWIGIKAEGLTSYYQAYLNSFIAMGCGGGGSGAAVADGTAAADAVEEESSKAEESEAVGDGGQSCEDFSLSDGALND